MIISLILLNIKWNSTLEHQRNYETHVKFIDLAKQMDEGGASLMRVPD